MNSWFIRTCAVASASLLVLSGCSDGKKEPGRSGPPSARGSGHEKPIASQPMADDEGPAHVDLIALDRTAHDTVTVRLRVVNDGGDSMALAGLLSDAAPDGKDRGANGIALLDGAADKVYYPLTTGDGTCLCSDTTDDLGPGKARDVYAVFPAPPGRTRVTVWVPRALPFLDVRIGSGQAPPAPDQSLDPGKTSLGAPTIRSLVNSSESADRSVDEDDRNRTVRLSADVLFAYNKADLTAKARSVLRSVAEQIDASRGSTVKIDGYTDNTGSDAVNQPLSERRAQAVEGALKGMVTRQGIVYQAAGHGSQNPIAKNDDEAGRRLNRRVTVSFAKPPEPSSPTPVASSAGSAPRWTPGGRLPVIATVRPHVGSGGPEVEQEANNVRFDVNYLYRDADGLVILIWSATDVGADEQPIASRLDKLRSLEYTDGINTSGVNLLDTAGRTRYWPSRDGAGVCMCSSLRLDFHGTQNLVPNRGATFVDVFKPPAGVGHVDVRFSWDTLTFSAGSVAIA